MTDNNQLVIDALTSKLVIGQSEQVYGLSAPLKAQCLMEDNKTYRYVSMDGNEEFLLTGVRIGARQQVIFEFAPMDAKPFKQMEMDEKTVFKVFPELEDRCCHVMGANDVGFITARKRYTTRVVEEAKAAQAEADANANAQNPLWGMFS